MSEKSSALCKSLDTLLDGGLKRGLVLEISGPPGSCKEALAVNFTKSVLKRKQRILFVGMFLPIFQIRILSAYLPPDMQNMTTATQLLNALSCKDC